MWEFRFPTINSMMVRRKKSITHLYTRLNLHRSLHYTNNIEMKARRPYSRFSIRCFLHLFLLFFSLPPPHSSRVWKAKLVALLIPSAKCSHHYFHYGFGLFFYLDNLFSLWNADRVYCCLPTSAYIVYSIQIGFCTTKYTSEAINIKMCNVHRRLPSSPNMQRVAKFSALIMQ